MNFRGGAEISNLMSANPQQKKSDQKSKKIELSQYTKVVEFLLNGKHFVVDLHDVKEIVHCGGITKLPNTPQHIHGIIDIRGQITTVIDPKKYLNITGIQESELGKCKIIVLDEEKAGTKVGMLVDEVVAVTTYTKDDINTSINVSSNSYIKGVMEKVHPGTRPGDPNKIELIVWIDVSKFMEGL